MADGPMQALTILGIVIGVAASLATIAVAMLKMGCSRRETSMMFSGIVIGFVLTAIAWQIVVSSGFYEPSEAEKALQKNLWELEKLAEE